MASQILPTPPGPLHQLTSEDERNRILAEYLPALRRYCIWLLRDPAGEDRKNISKIGLNYCAYVEAYRKSIGSPEDGLIFCYSPTRSHQSAILRQVAIEAAVH